MTSLHAVIIPHFDDVVRLHRCLSALAAEDLSGTEILVVDNASTQPLDGLRRDFPMVRFITEPSRGAAHARNRGVRETAAQDIFFLDADCLPAPGWLTTARQSVGLADLVGGAIGVFDETPPPRSGAQAFETVFAFNYRDYILNKGFSVTANLLTRRAVFDDVGPFIDGVSEDAEWCLRARSKGYRIALAEDLRVSHPTRSDWPALVDGRHGPCGPRRSRQAGCCISRSFGAAPTWRALANACADRPLCCGSGCCGRRG
jgi:GT2 family glycosyltransferase